MTAFVAAKDSPLHLGRGDDFSRVRNFLQTAAFDELNVCRALGVKSMGNLGAADWKKCPLEAVPPPLRWCLQVFMRGQFADHHESRTICGPEIFDAFCSLGLLRPARKIPTAVVCPVWLYPCDGFLIASDRTDDPDGDVFQPGEDVVFPAIYPGTLRFLELLPDAQKGEALDLCGGSGIGALHLSRNAQSATTTDLAERSAVFANFKGHLNGINLESVCGDLYEPVRERQFGLITAHPPFVPAVGPNMVYRDGGDTGEEITRRIVAGLPAHLRPGGTCVILCVAIDTEKATFEKRAKEWLGPEQDHFDLVYGCEKILSVDEVIASLRRGQKSPNDHETQKLSERLRSINTRQFPYGALFIRRLTGAAAQEPLRLQLTPAGRAADFERVLAWRELARRPDFSAWLVNLRPRLANQLELTIRHAMRDGELVPVQCTFAVEAGFQAALRPDGWIVPVVARLNGGKSVREIFEEARSANELPSAFTLDAFAGLVSQMITHGFIIPDDV